LEKEKGKRKRFENKKQENRFFSFDQGFVENVQGGNFLNAFKDVSQYYIY